MRGHKSYAIYGVYACQLSHNRAIEIAAYGLAEQSHDAVVRQCVINDLLATEKTGHENLSTGMINCIFSYNFN